MPLLYIWTSNRKNAATVIKLKGVVNYFVDIVEPTTFGVTLNIDLSVQQNCVETNISRELNALSHPLLFLILLLLQTDRS